MPRRDQTRLAHAAGRRNGGLPPRRTARPSPRETRVAFASAGGSGECAVRPPGKKRSPRCRRCVPCVSDLTFPSFTCPTAARRLQSNTPDAPARRRDLAPRAAIDESTFSPRSRGLAQRREEKPARRVVATRAALSGTIRRGVGGRRATGKQVGCPLRLGTGQGVFDARMSRWYPPAWASIRGQIFHRGKQWARRTSIVSASPSRATPSSPPATKPARTRSDSSWKTKSPSAPDGKFCACR